MTITLMLLILLSLTACQSVASLSHELSERQVTSCIWANGGYPPFGSLRVVTATGGAQLSECLKKE